MKILGIIPARGGSKGVPKKNSKHLGGLPLVTYTIRSAQESTFLSDCILSTDDEEIAQIGRDLGMRIPFMRPEVLASDTAKSIDVVQHAVSFLKEKGEQYDAICLLQPTVPFRAKDAIDKAIERYKDQKLDALVSVLPVPHEYNPHWVFLEEDTGLLKVSTGDNEIISRRQELPAAYHRDGSIYITSTVLVEKGTFYGDSLGFIVSSPEMHVNIDTLADWERAEALTKSL